MKKTIAILLVLVIAMAGVFAADTSPVSSELDLKTTIDLIFQSKLVGSANKLVTVDATSFDAITTANLLAEQSVSPSLTTSFGYLYIKTNSEEGYKLKITGEKLTSTTTASEINYVLTAGTATYTSSTNTSVEYSTSGNLTALSVNEFPVSVAVVANDWNTALAGNYTADVTFEFTTI